MSGPGRLSGTSGTVRIRNDGGQLAAWTASSGNAAFGVGPAQGALGAGEAADLTVTVDPSRLAEGTHTTTITVGAEHGGRVEPGEPIRQARGQQAAREPRAALHEHTRQPGVPERAQGGREVEAPLPCRDLDEPHASLG